MYMIKKFASLLTAAAAAALCLAVYVYGATTDVPDGFEFDESRNILSGSVVVNSSGYINENEKDVFLIDGIIDRKWCSTRDTVTRSAEYNAIRERGFCQFITLDLREVKCFDSYRMYHASNCFVDFGVTAYDTVAWTLEISDDMKEWYVVHEMADNYDAISDIYLGPRRARYVRLLIAVPNQSGDETVRLPEFMLFGCDEAPIVSATVLGYNNEEVLAELAALSPETEDETEPEIDGFVFGGGEITAETGTAVTPIHITGIIVCAVMSLSIGAAAGIKEVKASRRARAEAKIKMKT